MARRWLRRQTGFDSPAFHDARRCIITDDLIDYVLTLSDQKGLVAVKVGISDRL